MTNLDKTSNLTAVGSWMSSPWSCEQCQAEFSVGGLLAHHLSQCKGLTCSYMSYSQVKLTCPICLRAHRKRSQLISDDEGTTDRPTREKVYHTIDALDKHLERCPSRRGRQRISSFAFSCDYCNREFSQLLPLVQHIVVYHEVYRTLSSLCPSASSSTPQYRCTGCSKLFSTSFKLARHINKSTDCQGCVVLADAMPKEEASTAQDTQTNDGTDTKVPVYRAVALLAQTVAQQAEFQRRYPSSRIGMEYVTYTEDNKSAETKAAEEEEEVAVEENGKHTESSPADDKTPLEKSESIIPTQEKKPEEQNLPKSKKGKAKSEKSHTDKSEIKSEAAPSHEDVTASRKRKSQSLVGIASLLPAAMRHKGKKRKLGDEHDAGDTASTNRQEGITESTETAENAAKKEADDAMVTDKGENGVPAANGIDKSAAPAPAEVIKSSTSKGLDEVLNSVPNAKESMRDRAQRIRSLKKQNSLLAAKFAAEAGASLMPVAVARAAPTGWKSTGGAKPPNAQGMTARKSTGGAPKQVVKHVDPAPPRVVTCPACCTQFSSLVQRDAHLKQSHQGLKVFGCQVCGQGWDTYQGFRLHCTKRHPDKVDLAMYGESAERRETSFGDGEDNDLEFVCTKCCLAFYTESVLLMHMEKDHGNKTDNSNEKDDEEEENIVEKTDELKTVTVSIVPSAKTIPEIAPVPRRPLMPSSSTGDRPDDFSFLAKKSVFIKPVTVNNLPREILPTAASLQPVLSRWERLWLAYYDVKVEDLRGPVPLFPNAFHSPLCCRQCGEEMHNELEGLIHWKREHSGSVASGNNLLACQVCFQLFLGPNAVPDIKMHMKSAHDERSGEGFACGQCGEMFHRQKLLEWHTEMHSKVLPTADAEPPASGDTVHPALYVCPHCAKLFAGQSSYSRLQTHLATCAAEETEDQA